MSALSTHCLRVYDAMAESASVETTSEGDMLVYEGALTRLITTKLNMSTPYYTKVTRVLKGLGSIKQLRRGGGGAASQWWMVQRPTEEDIDKFRFEEDPDPALQGVHDVNVRLAKLEQDVLALKAMVGFDDYIAREQLRALEDGHADVGGS